MCLFWKIARKKNSTESQVVTFHWLRCWYLRLAFFPAKPNHRFENEWHAKLLASK